MECLYDKKECSEYNTATNTLDIQCKDCKRHDDWSRPTGDTPLLHELLQWVKKLKRWIDK